MNTEIYIEGQSIDLTEDLSVMLTLAIDDVTNIASRDTGFSKTIVLPGTAHNNLLFGHAFEFTAYNTYNNSLPNVGSNFNAAKSAKCVILQSGIQIFKGVIRLMEIINDGGLITYEAMVVGELGGLMTGIGNRLLTGNVDTAGHINASDDLDFSDYNEQWNATNIFQSWTDLAATGYLGYGVYYPLLDYGKCTTNRIDFSYQALRPALYVHEYLVKIFAKSGYTFECPFFETAFFRRLIVPHNEDVVYTNTRVHLDHRTVFAGNALTDVSATNILVNFATSVLLSDFTYSSGTFTYTGGTGLLARISSAFQLAIGGGEGRVLITAELRVNGVTQATQLITLGSPYGAFFTTANVNLDIPAIGLTTSDTVNVRLTKSYPGTAPLNPWHIDVVADGQITATFATTVQVAAIYNDPLSMNNMIPKGVLQKDFLLSIIKLFNLRIVEDPQTEKHLIIEPYPDFFDNSSPLDWSMKVDRSKEITLQPMSEVSARYFNFLYEQDSDFDNDTYKKRFGKGYADRTFDSGLDFVKEKKDLKIIFAGSPLVGVSGLDKAVTRIMKVDGSGVEERIGSKIRILQAKVITVTSWDILDEDLATVIASPTSYGYAGHVDDPGTPQGEDLNFGAPAEIYWVPANPYLATNLFAAFYSPYMAEITDKDSKLLTCHVLLSPVEMFNIDFGKSILIDGQLWRLQKIEDYNAVDTDVCKFQGLKVINLSY